jgi:hypothetical protein
MPTDVIQTFTITPTATLAIKTPTFTPKPLTPTFSPQEIAGTVLTDLSIDEMDAFSPDGMCEWKRLMAFPVTELAVNNYAGQYFTYVTVTCANQAPLVLVNEWKDWGLGYPQTSLLGWSADGGYAYYDDAIIPDGCQPPGGFQGNVRRVNLGDGKIEPIPITLTGGLTLSPDTTKMIFYDRETAEVGVFDFVTGKEQRMPFEIPEGVSNWFAGEFTWSPDGNNAVFLIQYGDACFPSGSSIRRIDLEGIPAQSESDWVTTLLEKEDGLISILEWSQLDRILISVDNIEWWLDPWSGNLVR